MATVGTFIKSMQGYRTYLPNPLPPKLEFSILTQQRVEEATYLLGQVEMCRTLLPNVSLLLFSSLQREAIASSTIEGTIATPEELVRFQVAHQAERSDVKEVANYGNALKWGAAALATRTITVSFMCSLHKELLAGVRGESMAGQLKRKQNAIGQRPDSTIHEAIFVPCPPERVQELMDDLDRYINQTNAEPKVVQCALIHHQFETIHPFGDGNGRTGRLLIVLHLMQMGLLTAPLIYPSVYFERSRDEYYSRLQAVRDRGEWDQWIEYVMRAIIFACKATVEFTQTIGKLRTDLNKQATDIRRRASYSSVLNAFFEEPFLTIRDISDKLHMSHITVETALTGLKAQGIVFEITGKTKGRVFACKQVLKAVFGDIGLFE